MTAPAVERVHARDPEAVERGGGDPERLKLRWAQESARTASSGDFLSDVSMMAGAYFAPDSGGVLPDRDSPITTKMLLLSHAVSNSACMWLPNATGLPPGLIGTTVLPGQCGVPSGAILMFSTEVQAAVLGALLGRICFWFEDQPSLLKEIEELMQGDERSRFIGDVLARIILGWMNSWDAAVAATQLDSTRGGTPEQREYDRRVVAKAMMKQRVFMTDPDEEGHTDLDVARMKAAAIMVLWAGRNEKDQERVNRYNEEFEGCKIDPDTWFFRMRSLGSVGGAHADPEWVAAVAALRPHMDGRAFPK